MSKENTYFYYINRDVSRWVRDAGPGIALIFITISGLYFFKQIPDNFFGEDFSLFYYSEIHNYFEAFMSFVKQYGRFPEAFYWTTSYQILGYQPAVHHFLSLMLSLIAACLGSLVLYRVFPTDLRSRLVTSLLIFLVFFNPFTISWSLIISGDNSRISTILYFISVLMLQEWKLAAGKVPWLVASFIVFFFAVLTYENISFLFPAGLLLAFPLAKANNDQKVLIKQFVALGFVSFFISIIPILIYSQMNITSHPAFYGEGVFTALSQRIIPSISTWGYLLLNAGAGLFMIREPLQILPGLLLLGTFVTASVLVARRYKDLQGRKLYFVFLAVIWLCAFSVLTYAIAYPGLSERARTVRYFSIAVYSFSTLLVLILYLTKNVLARIFVLTTIFFVILSGFNEYKSVSNFITSEEPASIVSSYLDLIAVVPAVRSSSVFLFVDNEFGEDPWSGCSVVLQMLYSTGDLRCIYLSSEDEGLRAIQYGTELFSPEGGTVRNGFYIIIGEGSDGKKYIVSEITSESNLLIDWIKDSPIKTDYGRIVLHPQSMVSGMVRKLLEME